MGAARAIVPTLQIWELPGGEITQDTTGRYASRTFEGPRDLFLVEPHASRFALGREWDEGDDYDGFETMSAVMRLAPGGMARLSLELADDGALVGNDQIEELPQEELEVTAGDIKRRLRYYAGPVADIEDDGWMAPGSAVADRAGFVVESKRTKRVSEARATATVTIANAIASDAGETGISVGEIELDWLRSEEKIQRHPDFAALTYDELVQVEDFVQGSRVDWEDVEHDDADTTAVQLQKKLARLRIANRNTFVRNLPVVRQTIQLPEPPDTGYGDERVLENFSAGVADVPPLRVLREDGSEYYWVREADRLSRADSGRWQRRIEWQGHIVVPILEATSIDEDIL